MKNKIFKTGISVLLMLSMFVSSAIKLQAETYTGTSDNITYTIDTEKKVITIEGKGILDSFDDTLSEKEFLKMRDTHCDIGEGITQIKRITGHYYMKSIHLPSTLKVIDDEAFGHCWHLESIEIPAGVEKIEKTAFYNCQKLQTVTNNSAVEVFLPTYPDLNNSNNLPFDYYVDGELSVTVPPGKTAIGKAKQYVAMLHSKGGTYSKQNARGYKYYRSGELLKLPVVKRKGYIFCGWTAKNYSNYAWRNITNEDTEDPYGSTLHWYGQKDLYAQFAKVDTKKLGKRKLKVSISEWRNADQLEIQYSTNKNFKKHQSIIVKSERLMKIWEFGKKNKEKHYKLNYNRKKKMLSITLSKLKANKKYYFRFQYSGNACYLSCTNEHVYVAGDWIKKSVKM